MLFAAILVVALAGSGRAAEQSCKLTLQTDLDSKMEPLVLKISKIRNQKEQVDIARPEVEDKKGVLTIDESQQLLLACTTSDKSLNSGKENNLKATRKETGYISCSKGKLMVDGKRATKNNLCCTKSYAESSIRVYEKETCGSGDDTGIKVQLGFEVNDEGTKSWFPLVDLCHNVERSVTLYSNHALYGKSLLGSVKSSERRPFSNEPKGELFLHVNPNSAYVRRGQIKAFDKILGTGGNELYINNTVYLARGHLSPDADFIYNSGQLLTYYYVNVAPQWQTFNAGNWLAIENAVRDLAAKEDETLNVYTGTYGVLKLKNAEGQERMIYLEPTKKLIAVPEVYWKLVQHPVKKSCTVAVGHNNVFLTETPEPICNKVKADGWPELTRLEKGYVYYCDYDSFKETVTYAPQIDCKDIFEFPEVSQQKITG